MAACLRDNVFGTVEEDARRRDFTVNALYFECRSGEMIDYHGGLADLKKRTLRIIGDPETRFPRRPGAHAARGAAGREARPDHR
jgi:poly(A) polymerase